MLTDTHTLTHTRAHTEGLFYGVNWFLEVVTQWSLLADRISFPHVIWAAVILLDLMWRPD